MKHSLPSSNTSRLNSLSFENEITATALQHCCKASTVLLPSPVSDAAEALQFLGVNKLTSRQRLAEATIGKKMLADNAKQGGDKRVQLLIFFRFFM